MALLDGQPEGIDRVYRAVSAEDSCLALPTFQKLEECFVHFVGRSSFGRWPDSATGNDSEVVRHLLPDFNRIPFLGDLDLRAPQCEGRA